jgi:hypothetical protein
MMLHSEREKRHGMAQVENLVIEGAEGGTERGDVLYAGKRTKLICC